MYKTTSGSSHELEKHVFCPWCGVRYSPGAVDCSKCNNARLRATRMSLNGAPVRHWHKILYERQPFEDNYVDDSFLENLITNANVQSVDYWTIVRESIAVSQQISTVCGFGLAFWFTQKEVLTVKFLLIFDAVLMMLGYLFRMLTDPSLTIGGVQSNIKTTLIIVGSLYALSPVLQTLTRSFADDTIWFLTVVFTALHLFFYDYRYVNAERQVAMTGTVSTNAAIFASVLLASRLPTVTHVFAILLLAVELFILFPVLRHIVKMFSGELHYALGALMFAILTAMMCPVSYTLAFVFVCCTLGITMISPYFLVKVQKYKNEINGPWDIAVPITS